MSELRALAAAAGLAVEVTDLGDWGGTRLISEYDAQARTIRVNVRALDAYGRQCGPLTPDAARRFIDLAVAHELYHHGEAAGTIELATAYDGRKVAGAIGLAAPRREREAAADAWARAHVPVDAHLAAFLTHRRG